MVDPSEEPGAYGDASDLRTALARIVTAGPDEAIFLPELRVLLALPAMRQRFEARGDGSQADAMIAALAAAIASVPTPAYRRLLEIVLGLEAPYRRLSPYERRAAAGREFRGGSRPVKPNTIRQFHEPKALDELTSVIAAYEAPLDHASTDHAASAPRRARGSSMFGTPDGNAVGLEDALSAFVSFEGRRFRAGLGMAADDRQVRVIVGSKGSGKTLYLRRLQASAQREPSLYADQWQPNALSTGDVVHVSDWSASKTETIERWERLWHRATIRAVISHLVGTRHPSFGPARAHLKAMLGTGYPKVLAEPRGPRSIYSEVSAIVHSHHSKQSVDAFLNDPEWGTVEEALVQSMQMSPPMFFYLDALDERFEIAPRHWLLCQLGLFRFLVSSRSFQHFAGRLHVVITLRDIVFSAALESEHASRYVQNPSIRFLDWNADAIGHFLRQKIDGLSSEYLAGNLDGPPIERWLGHTTLADERRDRIESVESYLIRHTRLLPRDIVVLGNDLCMRLDMRLDQGHPGITEADIREVVARASRAFGIEQLRIVANHAVASMLPHGAGHHGYVESYIGDDSGTPTAIQGKMVVEITKLLRSLQTDRFDASALSKFDAQAQRYLPETDLASLLWQHRLLGCTVGNVEHGTVDFYGSERYSELSLPREVDGYALHPILLDAIPSLRAVGESVYVP